MTLVYVPNRSAGEVRMPYLDYRRFLGILVDDHVILDDVHFFEVSLPISSGPRENVPVQQAKQTICTGHKFLNV